MTTLTNRIELIKEIYKTTDFDKYLEIGSQRGHSFLPLKCKYKVAVDPQFLIRPTKKLKWLIRNPLNINNKYFEETSDDFFENRKGFLSEFGNFDVVLVDGLHTFEAALNDVLNSVVHLSENGIIIMHDCLPPHKAASLPTKQYPNEEERKVEGWTGEWCGDVWKSIIYMHENLSEFLDIRVLNIDCGLGIVRLKNNIKERPVISKESFDRIDKMTYEEMMKDRDTLLNLKAPDHAMEVAKEVSGSV